MRLLIVVVGAAVLLYLTMAGCKDPKKIKQQNVAPVMVPAPKPLPVPAPKPPPVPVKKCWGTIDKSPEAVKGRAVFVEKKLPAAGLIKKTQLSSKGTARVQVTPAFLTLDYEDKQEIMGIVYAYHFDGCDESLLLLISTITGKVIGTYGRLGLDLR